MCALAQQRVQQRDRLESFPQAPEIWVRNIHDSQTRKKDLSSDNEIHGHVVLNKAMQPKYVRCRIQNFHNMFAVEREHSRLREFERLLVNEKTKMSGGSRRGALETKHKLGSK